MEICPLVKIRNICLGINPSKNSKILFNFINLSQYYIRQLNQPERAIRWKDSHKNRRCNINYKMEDILIYKT